MANGYMKKRLNISLRFGPFRPVFECQWFSQHVEAWEKAGLLRNILKLDGVKFYLQSDLLAAEDVEERIEKEYGLSIEPGLKKLLLMLRAKRIEGPVEGQLLPLYVDRMRNGTESQRRFSEVPTEAEVIYKYFMAVSFEKDKTKSDEEQIESNIMGIDFLHGEWHNLQMCLRDYERGRDKYLAEHPKLLERGI